MNKRRIARELVGIADVLLEKNGMYRRPVMRSAGLSWSEKGLVLRRSLRKLLTGWDAQDAVNDVKRYGSIGYTRAIQAEPNLHNINLNWSDGLPDQYRRKKLGVESPEELFDLLLSWRKKDIADAQSSFAEVKAIATSARNS